MIATVFENLATNPSFETASGTVTVRTNLSTNPNAVGTAGFSNNNVANWTVTKNVSITGHPQGITTAAKSTMAAGHAATTDLLSMYNVDTLGTSTGTSRYLGAWVWVNASGYQTRMAIDSVSFVALAAQTWVFVPNATLVAAGSNGFAQISKISGNVTDDTDYAYITGVTALAAGVPTESIWGGRAAAGDFTYAWSGTVDASTSIQTAPGVAGGSAGSGGVAVSSSDWIKSGGKSVRVIPKNSTTASYAIFSATGLTAGLTYTIMATVRLPSPLAGTLDSNSRGFYVSGVGVPTYHAGFEPPANEAGEKEVRGTFVANGTSATVYLLNGASAGNGDVWWDDLLIIEGVYTGSYFDGGSTSDDMNVYTWAGVAHASTSRWVAFLYGANLTIGRFGTDITVDSVAQWDDQGDRVTVSGQTPYGSVPDALTLRQQLMGYVDSPDETFVPVTWADQPSVNGFYRVVSARVDPSKAGAYAGVFLFSVELERVQGFAAPLIECVALGKLRATPLTLTKRPTQAIPAGGRSYVEYHPADRALIPRGVNVKRAGEASVLNVFSAFANDYIVGQYYLPAARFYEGAATVKVGGRVIAGRQASNTPTDWQITNDLLQVEPVAGTDFAIRIRMWNSGAWSPWSTVTFGWASSGTTRTPMKPPHTVTILANAPEGVTVRLLSTTGLDYSPVSVDITMRRGARGVSVDLRSVFESDFAVNLTGFTTSTALTGGHSQTTSGVTTFIGSAKKISVNSNGDVYPDQDLVQFVKEYSFGVGLTNSLETAQTLLNEYFWAGSEKQTVVAR